MRHTRLSQSARILIKLGEAFRTDDEGRAFVMQARDLSQDRKRLAFGPAVVPDDLVELLVQVDQVARCFVWSSGSDQEEQTRNAINISPVRSEKPDLHEILEYATSSNTCCFLWLQLTALNFTPLHSPT